MAFRMGLLGKKIGMTQVFGEDGERVPVTAIAAGPCVVIAKRTIEKDSYTAIQIGFEEKKASNVAKAQLGTYAKANIKAPRLVREIRLTADEAAKFEVGQVLTASDVFQKGIAVDVVGRSKGKGFQGVLKRHHLGGSRATHGSHEFFRHGGSIGCRLTPGRVHKGKRMSGHMGDETTTLQNLELLDILAEENVILIRGNVPGATNGYVLVSMAVKKALYKRKRYDLIEEKSKNPMKASKAGSGAAKPKK